MQMNLLQQEGSPQQQQRQENATEGGGGIGGSDVDLSIIMSSENNNDDDSPEPAIKPPFCKFRLAANSPVPALDDEPLLALQPYQEAWTEFWHQATLAVQACERDETHWRRWLYPRLFPFGILLIATLILLVIELPVDNDDDDNKNRVWQAVIYVVVAMAIWTAMQNCENRIKNQRRHKCIQYILQEPGDAFCKAVSAGNGCGSNNNTVVLLLCQDHAGIIELLKFETGISVTLWISSTTGSLEDDDDYRHDYSRVLVHKGHWYRKLLGYYPNVPLVRDTILMQPPPHDVDAEAWQDYWTNIQDVQTRLRTFHPDYDGFYLLSYPAIATMLVAQQLEKWAIVGATFGGIILIAILICCKNYRTIGQRKQEIMQELQKQKDLSRRFYQSGFCLHYRVIKDYEEHNGEECHYVYIFTTKPPGP